MQSKWTPYPWVCFSMCVGVMGTALASPLYPIYQQAWGLQPSHITQIFVAYMFGALASLLFLGRLTNRFGFLVVLRGGLILMTLGIISSALAWNVPSFAICRFVIGVASGLITTSASVGMTQLNNKGDLQRAAATTSLTIAFGFGLGPVVGGLMAQWLPMPLKTAYLPSILLGFLAIYALFQVRIPASANTSAGGLSFRDVMPALSQPRRPFLRHYMLGCMAAFSAFGMFSLFAALAPSFMQNMVPWHGPLVSGLSIGIILFMSAGIQLLARPVATKKIAITGFFALAASNLLLMANTQLGSPWLFALSVLTTATGHAMCNLAGMSIVNKVSKPANRTGLLSTYLIIGYLGTIVPILGLGWLSDIMGLTPALVVFCLSLSVLTTVLGVFSLRARVLPIPRQ
ncbi:MAG: MFS transporter [Comamonas sp.]|uniref:MFS transporter n=1 Tax=Comamonas sp. TaxID=34028 RepID=UPI0028299A0D|nr:MFS transporter [Comamonas sp.]MDR0214348.1 MFS transporter [Comamonas sp.]MDR2298167.1 MFS transporter [Comamonas sp.]